MFMETYGTPTIRALTRASRRFFETPPTGFCEHSLLTDRGVLYIARSGQEALLAETLEQLRATGAVGRSISAEEVLARVPCVRPGGLVGAIEEADAKAGDVQALLQGFRKGARQVGVEFSYGCAVRAAAFEDAAWKVELSSGETVYAKAVVNAAGAW